MREYTLYIWIGIWLFILPFLGFPGSWKDTLLALTAICIVAYTLFIYRERRVAKDAKTNSPSSTSAQKQNESTPQEKINTV